MAHWNIQISIQRVEEPKPALNEAGYPVKGLAGTPVMTERKVIKTLDLAIVADSEAEAYAKAHRMLNANQPAQDPYEYPMVTDGQGIPIGSAGAPQA